VIEAKAGSACGIQGTSLVAEAVSRFVAAAPPQEFGEQFLNPRIFPQTREASGHRHGDPKETWKGSPGQVVQACQRKRCGI